jgi:hypothetical protein
MMIYAFIYPSIYLSDSIVLSIIYLSIYQFYLSIYQFYLSISSIYLLVSININKNLSISITMDSVAEPSWTRF